MALDLLLKLDLISARKPNIEEIKAELLKGFAGRFATYKLSSSGEAENAGDYLTKVEY